MPTPSKSTAAPSGDGPEDTPLRDDDVQRVYERALAHHRGGRLAEAVRDYTHVVRRSPFAADIYNNLGVALRAQGKAHAAVACYRRSLGLKPNAASVYTNLGNALRDLGEYTDAVKAHLRAVKYAPKSPKALFNAGLALRETDQMPDALAHLERAIKLEPTYALARVEHAFTLLRMGDWNRGFKELEIRFSLPGRDPRRKDIAVWNGTPIPKKTILINYEGTEGTAIQMARFGAPLKRMGAKVIMECPAHLSALFNACPGIDETHVLGAAVDNASIDLQIPLLSLPSRLGTQVDNLPADTAYLTPPKFAAQGLNVHPQTRLAIGLVWSGGWTGRPATGPHRSGDIELEDLGQLFAIPGLEFFSLERGLGNSDIARIGLQAMIQPLGPSILDVADLASAIEPLDLVICVDSVTAHIAGAMGKPVWMLTRSGANWCWLLGRDDSPWYPSMRLFRKTADQSWNSIASTVRVALTEVLKG